MKIIKKFKWVIVLILMLAITACSNEKVAHEIKKLPTLRDLITTFKDVDINYYITAVKNAVAQIPEAQLNADDFKGFIEEIKTNYSVSMQPEIGSTSVLTNIGQLSKLCSISSTTEENDPIRIINDAKLIHPGEEEIVTVVALQGTDFKNGQATGIVEDLLAGLELHNHYLYDAYNAILKNFNDTGNGPTGYSFDNQPYSHDNKPTLYIVGISLGGMIAQQLAGLEYLQENYNVKYVVAIASPIISPEIVDYKQTTVARMVMEKDLVPNLSQSAYKESKQQETSAGTVSHLKYYKNNKEQEVINNYRIYKNIGVKENQKANYKTFIGVHVLGYANEKVWSDVDVLGRTNNNKKGTSLKIYNLNENSIVTYPANVYESYKENLK